MNRLLTNYDNGHRPGLIQNLYGDQISISRGQFIQRIREPDCAWILDIDSIANRMDTFK